MSIFSTFCQNISDILTFRSADSLLFKYLRINQNKGGKHRFIFASSDVLTTDDQALRIKELLKLTFIRPYFSSTFYLYPHHSLTHSVFRLYTC